MEINEDESIKQYIIVLITKLLHFLQFKLLGIVIYKYIDSIICVS